MIQISASQIPRSLDNTFFAVEFVVTGILATNLAQYAWWRCKAKGPGLTHWGRWAGAYYLLAAVPLMLAFHLAIVLIYIGEVGYPRSKMWHSGSWFPNTAHGILLYIGKWVGTVFMSIGVFKATDLREKIAARWHQVRAGKRTAPAEKPASAIQE